MKITSWNVNSVRKRINHIILLIKKVNPDVICLQETKVENSSFPVKTFSNLGYLHHYLNGILSYNGVCIISRIKSTTSNKINFERINLCVDNDKDLERAIWISDQMIQNNDNCYNIEEIIALAREWEENFSRLGKD